MDDAPILMKVVGLAGLTYTWSAVFFPSLRSVWKGSSVPLSRRSSLGFALGMSFWCAAVFGLGAVWCAVGFALSVGALFLTQRKDQDAYFRARGSSLAEQEAKWRKASIWGSREKVLAICGGMMALQMIGFISLALRSPLNEEQRLILYANLILFVMFLGCFLTVYFGRNKRE